MAQPAASDDRATRSLIDRVVARDAEATRVLIVRLLPVIQARVRRGRARFRDLRTVDERDLIQDVWITLLAENAAQLSAWDPERGASLEGYVGMIAEREVANLWQKAMARKRRGQTLALEGVPEPAESGPSPEATAVDRDTAARLGEHLAGALPEKGLAVFRYLYTDELSPEQVADALGVSRQVVYNWRHKIRELAREFLERRTG